MTNPLRGQAEIDLGGQTYKCRLTVDALINIETALDKSILAITQDLSQANVRLVEITQVLLHALRGGGNDFDEKKVKTIIQNTGIVQSCSAVAQLLVETLNDPNAEEEDNDTKK